MKRAGAFQKATGILLIVCALLTSGCHKKSFTHQSRFLDSDTSVVLVDAWILDHAPPLFQALIEYEGPNPSQKYDMRATLRSADGSRATGNLWNHPVPVKQGTDGKARVIWEFIDLPKNIKSLSLQIDFTDKATHTFQSMKFDLPRRSDL